ncbi:MAG: hypothetical protein RBT65_10815 [Methanolobus sp.]|nr:hypothetical protein [Methanolobus sp.]
MALTTNSKVWSIMLIVFAFLTIFFAILFHFKNLFIVLIVDSILVLVTDGIIIEFNKYFGQKSMWVRRMYAITVAISVFLLFYLLVLGQLYDMDCLISSSQKQ